MKSFISAIAVLSSVVSLAAAGKPHEVLTNAGNIVNGERFSHPMGGQENVNLFSLNRAAHKPKTLSNSELLARGLAPYLPGAKRHAPRRLKNFHHVRQAEPSQTPTNPTTGNIVVVSASGVLGYISQTLSAYGTFAITNDQSQAATFHRPAGEQTDFNLGVDGLSNDFAGLASGFSGTNWGPGSSGYGFFTPVDDSPAPATNTNNPTGQPAESSIWSQNPVTGELSVSWTNDDGDVVPTTLFYDLSFGDLDATGDLSSFQETYGDVVETVSFFLVEP